MISRLQKKYALSEQGAKDLFQAIVYSVLANISLMLPVALLAIVLDGMLPVALGTEDKMSGIIWYTIAGIIILAVIFIFHYQQYTKAYIGTYDESERRRITLAEKMRTLPLSFFHERDISDLTSTIMGDCAGFEHAFPYSATVFRSTDFYRDCMCCTSYHELENGACSFVGSTCSICDCHFIPKMAGKTWEKIYECKTYFVRGHSGMSGNRAGYQGM